MKEKRNDKEESMITTQTEKEPRGFFFINFNFRLCHLRRRRNGSRSINPAGWLYSRVLAGFNQLP